MQEQQQQQQPEQQQDHSYRMVDLFLTVNVAINIVAKTV